MANKVDTWAGDGAFPTTQWGLIQLSTGAPSVSESAVEKLCALYWRPLYAYLRRRGSSPEDAQDLVQSFIHRFVERRDYANAAPGKGRFRTYLLTCLKHHVIKESERQRAKKRGGGSEHLTLDALEVEKLCAVDLSAPTPEAAWDRQLARVLLERGLTHLRAEFVSRGKQALFDELAPFLDGADPSEYEQVAQKLGLRRNAVAVAVHRMRTRLRQLLLAELSSILGEKGDAEVELRELLATLAGN